MSNNTSKVWLVTGSSSGLGRDIAEAILESGDRLVATARKPDQLADLKQKYGEQVQLAALDVTDEGAANAAVQLAVDSFGKLDVLVNNAGFGNIIPFEQMTPDDFRSQVETNFFGVVNLSRAALPVLRQQRSGHIMQVSSVGGRVGSAGLSAYQAAKWAVGGFSEALAQEVAGFGVKVSVLEPGGMRTNWGTRAGSEPPTLMAEYEPTVGAFLGMLERYVGKETGDPKKVAQIILRLAEHANAPLHLLLGSDAIDYAGQTETARKATDELWKSVTLATDFDAPDIIPAFPSEQVSSQRGVLDILSAS
ncbi:SDR family NAD(P)-dependent oxidoreductase [bacterium]|nr:MAG: SDR family NAD(P)-dependent oxidoreductase [bacterium]